MSESGDEGAGNTDLKQKTTDWEKWSETVRTTHYRRADFLRRIGHLIGALAVILSAVVSAGILTSVHTNPSFYWKLAAGIIGVVISALTGLQSFFRFGEMSELHRVAAARFGAVRRELELLILAHPANDPAARTQLESIGKTVAMLEEKGPGFPGGLYRSIERGGRWRFFRRTSSRADDGARVKGHWRVTSNAPGSNPAATAPQAWDGVDQPVRACRRYSTPRPAGELTD